MTKHFYQSKTFWANVLGIVAMVAQMEYGWVLPAEWQVSILALLNMVLRLVTKTEIV